MIKPYKKGICHICDKECLPEDYFHVGCAEIKFQDNLKKSKEKRNEKHKG